MAFWYAAVGDPIEQKLVGNTEPGGGLAGWGEGADDVAEEHRAWSRTLSATRGRRDAVLSELDLAGKVLAALPLLGLAANELAALALPGMADGELSLPGPVIGELLLLRRWRG
jgi:hypothetical protein